VIDKVPDSIKTVSSISEFTIIILSS